MCRFFSAIVARDGQLFWSDQTDSHELLIQHFGLKEGSGAGMGAANFIRLEFAPTENKFADPESYSLRVDESETPVWFTDDMRETTIGKLKALIARMVVSDKRALLGGCWILTDRANITESINARVVWADGKAFGKFNAGDSNAGHYNAGNYNAGNYNSGNRNSGNRNAGHYNAGNYNAGFFCTATNTPKFFDKEWDGSFEEANRLIPYIELPVGCVWVSSGEMSDEEKKQFPAHTATGGFLRVTEMGILTAFPLAWKKLDKEEKARWTNLPNFDAEKFLLCTGVDVRKSKKSK